MGDRLRILIVDDDPDIRLVTQLALGLDPAISTVAVGCFEEALPELASAVPPNLVLLDVMMPVMDGPAMAKAIRRISGHANTPILFMTARARPADLELYRTLGAGVVVKPFDPLRLVDMVRGELAALSR